MSLEPVYREGTLRLRSPAQTLALLEPHLHRFGIRRCAEVTRLDLDFGVPVYMAIRPRARTVQSSAGKGLDASAAKVSALMEALELDVAERPPRDLLRRAGQAELELEGQRVDPLREWIDAAGRHFSAHFRIDWVEGEDLLGAGQVWIPAGAAYFHEPTPCRTNSNGLASGNHLVEASVHGLCELIERDALARLVDGPRLTVRRDCEVIDPRTVRAPRLARVIENIARADVQLVLLRVPALAPTYWALLLDPQPHASSSMLSGGFGAHLGHDVAMARAITEAIQSRLTTIHGAREDIVTKPVYTERARAGAAITAGPAYRFFAELEPTAAATETPFDGDLSAALDTLLERLRGAGHERLYRVVLPAPLPSLAVVKIIGPSLLFNPGLF